MSKKGQKRSFRALDELDPRLREEGMVRLLSGESLYDTHTRQLRPRHRERTTIQLRGVLLWATHFAKEQGKELRLYAQEKRLLSKIFHSNGTKLLVTALLACLLGWIASTCAFFLLSDNNRDGIPDMIEFLLHTQPSRPPA